jgi:ribose transport system permease protein
MNSKARRLVDYLAMVAIWAGLVLLFSLLSRNFFSTATFLTLANRIPPLAAIATGMTLVLIIGGIDLSVGSVLGLCGAVFGVLLVNVHWPFWPACAVALVIGVLAGWFNGAISVYLRIPSFIVTLGTLEMARGLAYMATHSQTVYIGSQVESLAAPVPGLRVSTAFLITLGIVAFAQLILSKTVFGRLLVGIGTNEQAVRLSGINPNQVKLTVFLILGFLSGLAGIFYTARLGSADPNAGSGMELGAIAAVVIGGTSLAGGRGSVVNSFVGVLIIATLEAGLAHVGVSEPVKRLVTGSVIVIAVTIDSVRRRRTE